MRNLNTQLVSAALLAPQGHSHLGSSRAALVWAMLEDLPSTEPAGDYDQGQELLDNEMTKLFLHFFMFQQS